MGTPDACAAFLLYLVVQLLALVSLFPAAHGGGFSFRLIHRDSVHSVLYPGNLTDVEFYSRLVNYSGSQGLLQHDSLEPETITAMVNPIMNSYYAEVNVGAAGQSQYLLIDTGSDLIWFQCEPCDPCFPQDNPMYVMGPNFPYMSCDDPLCLVNRRFRCDDDNCCAYTMKYVTGSPALGVMGRESFLFESTNGGEEKVPSLAFGCTNSCSDMFGRRTEISGIMGLGGGPQSLPQQMGPAIGHRFSHCLVPMKPGSIDFTFLRFGDDIRLQSDVQHTPLLRDAQFPSFYYVKLQGISFDGVRLPIPSEVFRKDPRRSHSGVIVDCGTWYSKLISPAHSVARSALIEHFAAYELVLEPISQSLAKLTCFKVGEGQAVPLDFKVTFHFNGADMVVQGDSLILKVNVRQTNSRYFCVGMASAESHSVIASMQMVNKRIVYDLAAETWSFADEDCALSG